MARRRRRSDATVASGRITVTATQLGETDETEETLEVQKFETDPAYVRINAGVTRSIGDYESLRVDVAISVPCYKEEIDDIVETVGEMVNERLDIEVDNYLGEE